MEDFKNPLNPHSNLASLYRYFFLKDELPMGFCNYFWGLVIALICTPFMWPAMLANKYAGVINTKETKKPKFDDDNNLVGMVVTKTYKMSGKDGLPTPFGLLLTLGLFLIGVLVLTISQLFIAGMKDYLNSLGGFASTIILYTTGVGFVGLIILIVYLVIERRKANELKRKLGEAKLSFDERVAIEEKKKKKEAIKEAKRIERIENPNIFKLAWARIVAWKENNCPVITWDYDGEVIEPIDKD